MQIASMRQSTRLVFNTLITFSRMALTVGIGLVTTRLFLDALGKVDFGLLSALGATGALLTTVTLALAASTQRHLAYEIGRGDALRVARTFSSALVMFAVGGVVLWLAGVALTPVVMGVLTIPAERADVAWWVYQTTLVGLVAAVVFTPYQGIIAAHQELIVSTVYELLSSVLRLTVVLLLFVVPFDRLLFYAVAILITRLTLAALLAGWCLYRYQASRPRRSYAEWAIMKELGSFAGWSFFNHISWALRQQAAVLIINVGFGPAVNAAFAVAIQVAGYAGNLSQAVARAVRPAITSLEAKGSRKHVHRLTVVTSKYLFILLSMPLVPILLDLENVLGIWLGDVPEHTVTLVAITIAWVLATQFGRGFNMALEATGDIGWWTRINLGLTLATLVLAWALVFVFDFGPWAVPGSILALVLAYVPLAALLIGRHIELAVRRWLAESVRPALLVTAPPALVAAWVQAAMPQTVWRVVAVAAVYIAIALPLLWRVGLAQWEREQFKRIAGAGLGRARETAGRNSP